MTTTVSKHFKPCFAIDHNIIGKTTTLGCPGLALKSNQSKAFHHHPAHGQITPDIFAIDTAT